MKQTIRILGLVAFLAIVARAWPRTQQPPGSAVPSGNASAQAPLPQRGGRIVVRTYTVIVPVTVKDTRGQLVAGLQKRDFRIFADGVEQQIENFSAAAVPLSAVILIDNDLPDRSAGQVQKSLVSISAGFGPGDEAALVTYDQYPNTIAGFTLSNDKLFTQLKRLQLGSHSNMVIADPTTAGPMVNGQPLPTGRGIATHGSMRYHETEALNDAIYDAASMLKSRGRDRRKIIFLISDGSNSAHNVHTFDETLQYLLSNDVSVYSISVTRSVPLGRSLLQRGLSDLAKYALDTGGDTFYASKERDLDQLYASVTEEARYQYTLTFSPQGVNPAKDYHSIEVRVERPDLSVEARQGYYQSAIIVRP